jgi:hypothetical protein
MVTNNTNITDSSEFDSTPDEGLNLVPLEGAEVAEQEVSDTTVPTDDTPVANTEVTPQVPSVPNSDLASLQAEQTKLEQQRMEMQQNQLVRGLEEEALSMERRLVDQGLSDTEAKDQTMSHLKNRVGQIQGEQQRQQEVQIVQGKRNAALHFAKQYGLGIDDLTNLERANTPQEMEAMAKTQSTIAKQAVEIEALKRGQVPPQQLDNNSPAPAANASNDQRMLDAYLQGDRSPAALAAVKKLQGM